MNLVNRFTVFNITRQTRLVTVHPNLVRTPTGEPLGPHRVSRGTISSGTSLATSNVTGVTETSSNSKSAMCGHFSCSSLKFTLLSGTFKRSTTRTLCTSNLVPKSFNWLAWTSSRLVSVFDDFWIPFSRTLSIGPSRPGFFATSVASRLQALPVSNIAYVLKYPFGPYRVTDTTCNKTESLLLLWDALECSVDGVAASGVVWLVDAAVSIHCSHQVLHFSTNAEICIVSSCTPIHSTRFQVSTNGKPMTRS